MATKLGMTRLFAAICLSVAAAGTAATEAPGGPLIYKLAIDESLSQQALIRSRFSAPVLPLRLQASAGLAPGHELRLLSTARPDAPIDLNPGGGFGLSPLRATWRYALFDESNWALKLGVSANVRELSSGLRPALAGHEGMRFGALPLLHVAGERQWAQRWSLSFDFDGMMTPVGRAVDLGVRVNYSLARDLTVYGGYQLTEAAGEAEAYYGAGPNNRANLGLRMRF
jgi:hypothetical protein